MTENCSQLLVEVGDKIRNRLDRLSSFVAVVSAYHNMLNLSDTIVFRRALDDSAVVECLADIHVCALTFGRCIGESDFPIRDTLPPWVSQETDEQFFWDRMRTVYSVVCRAGRATRSRNENESAELSIAITIDTAHIACILQASWDAMRVIRRMLGMPHTNADVLRYIHNRI